MYVFMPTSLDHIDKVYASGPRPTLPNQQARSSARERP